MEFFATTAQVIPVLFLALLVERRFRVASNHPVAERLDSYVLAFFASGETAALLGVAGGETSDLLRFLVTSSLVMAWLFMLLARGAPALRRPSNSGVSIAYWAPLAALTIVVPLGALAGAFIGIFV